MNILALITLPTDCTSGLDGVRSLSELSTPLSFRTTLDSYIIYRSLSLF
jgi:hypothetical protein